MESLGFLLGGCLVQVDLGASSLGRLVATLGPVGSETEGSLLGLRLLGRVLDVLRMRMRLALLLLLLLLLRVVLLLLMLRRRRR